MRHVGAVTVKHTQARKAFMQVVASDDDDEEIDMAGTELLDNLTFITSKGGMGGVQGKPDWVTGIQGESLAVEELRVGENQGRGRIEFHGMETTWPRPSRWRRRGGWPGRKGTWSQAWSQHGTATNSQIIKLTSFIMTLVIAANIEQSFN